MSSRLDISTRTNFYKQHKLRNPSAVLFLILGTLGFYVFWWFYLFAKDLKNIDIDAPSENRALFIFLIIPSILYLFIFGLSLISFNHILISIIKNWGWSFVFFLVLKILFDFSQAYGKFTKTMGIYWFLGFFFASMGFVSIFFNNLYLVPLLLLFPIQIPAMQAQFNFWVDRLNIKKKSDAFYF